MCAHTSTYVQAFFDLQPQKLTSLQLGLLGNQREPRPLAYQSVCIPGHSCVTRNLDAT